ncbi:MAG: phosphoadenosine phosphosulfate reductase [Rhodobacteraceae bacterium]|nr:phosphoadenosine phosphosulfate reductase [Paracoccaceae bacterium]
MSVTDTAPDSLAKAPADLRDGLFQRLEELTADEGHFEAVGQHHWALFEDRGTTLLVTFDQLDPILASADGMPWGHGFAGERGWSHLCLMADGDTYFRDQAVYRHFDRLVDDAFFEDFDRVLFYGHGHGAHAACAFAVTAPGAQVLALNPRASLAGREVCWDRRTLPARQLDFTSRYGYAPDMLEGAGKVVVIHDLTLREEAMHSALFRAPWVTRLSAPLMGERIEWALRNMGVLPTLIEAAMAGKLTSALFATEWRKRRAFSPYLKALLEKAENAKRRGQAIAICRSVTQRLKAPHFARRLAKLTGEK